MPTPPRSYGPPGRGGPGRDDIRNMVIFFLLAALVFGAHEFLIGGPSRERAIQEQRAATQKAQVEQVEKTPARLERPTALAQSARVRFDNAAIDGSIALTGARFDDLSLKRHRQTVEKDSPEVTLLTPHGAKHGYDAYLGWEDPYTSDDVIGARTVWSAASTATLTPRSPITLTYTSPDGLVFTRTISVDDSYMFTVKDRIENTGTAPRTLHPISVVRRQDMPEDFIPNQIVHQGLSGMDVEGTSKNLADYTYQKAQKLVKDKARGKAPADQTLGGYETKGGWLGISDHYWMTALVPPQTEDIKATFDASPRPGYTDFRASYVGRARAIAPGSAIEYEQRVFAGAKRVEILKGYQDALGIPDFDRAVDWGFLWPMTRLFFWLLDTLGKWAGNFGLGILLTTIVVKAVLFPVVNSSFKSMAKLRKVQPQMKEIQERYAADKQRQQQEMMKLYQSEKINPITGCLPIFAQIPIFYALYKTLTVTIEMRHQPFFGWIKDLSARDPTNIFNLFGLIPFDPSTLPLIGGFLWLGAWPILYGVSMWATTSLSPPQGDPMTQKIFQLMPIIFTFLFAPFAAGLVIYWTWSNILSFIQQYIVMRMNGVETEIDKLIAKLAGKKADAPASS